MTQKELLSIAYAHGILITREIEDKATAHAGGDLTLEIQVLRGAIYALQTRLDRLMGVEAGPP